MASRVIEEAEMCSMYRLYIVVTALLLSIVYAHVASCYLNVTISNHTVVLCTNSTEPCMFKFFEGNVTISFAVYDSSLQHLYGEVQINDTYGFNISDPWFNDKIIMLNGTILFNSFLAEKLGIHDIELTSIRKTISVSIYIPQQLWSDWQPPMFLVSYESINNTPVWGQIEIIQAESYVGSISVMVDIPYYWYNTYGCFALYSLSTGKIYTWCGVQFEDAVYITLPMPTSHVIGSITVTTPSGVNVKIPPPVLTLHLTFPTTILSDLSTTSELGILGVALIMVVAIWAYKNENDPFTAAAIAGGIVGIIGAIIGNIVLCSIGFVVLATFLTYRIVKSKGYYY